MIKYIIFIKRIKLINIIEMMVCGFLIWINLGLLFNLYVIRILRNKCKIEKMYI